LSIDFSKIIPRIFRIQLVRVLKTLRKPFALWPLIAALPDLPDTRSSRPGHPQLTPRLRRPLPHGPTDDVTARSRSRILRLDNIQRSRRNRRPNNSRLYDRTNPVSITTPQGSLAAITVSLTSLNSFAGSVNLNYSLSPGITNVAIALNPDSVSLLTGSGTSTLTVSVPASAPLSTYTIVIDGPVESSATT